MALKHGSIVAMGVTIGFASAIGLHLSGSTTPLIATSGVLNNGKGGTSKTNPPSQQGSNSTSKTGTGANLPAPSNPTSPNGNTTATRSATGSMEQYGYGQLAVRVSVLGKKITGLNVVGLQVAESYSQQIATQVIPMLRSEVLALQSLQVQGISGATYTTEAYLYSIQSALNKLHIN